MTDPYTSELDSFSYGLHQQFGIGFGLSRPTSHVKLSGITDPPAPSRDTLWTRHMVGVRELERDRRRHGRVYSMTFTNSDRVLIGNVR